MRKFKSVTFIVVITLIFAMLLSSCKNQNKSSVSSDIVSSEITSSDTATSEPEKEKEHAVSNKPENSSKPEISSKPKETPKHDSSKNNTSSNFLSNITITSPFPRPQKEQEVSSELEDDDYWYDPDLTSSQETELDKHKKLIIGTWDFTYDLTPILIASGYDVKEQIVLPHHYTFNNDRSYFVTVSDKQAYYDKVGPYVIPKIETQLKNELRREHITESEFKLIMGMSVSDYAKKIFRNQVHTPIHRYGGYYFRDGKLCLGDTDSGTLDQCLYAFIDDDTLVITYDEGSITVRRHKEENTVTSEG